MINRLKIPKLILACFIPIACFEWSFALGFHNEFWRWAFVVGSIFWLAIVHWLAYAGAVVLIAQIVLDRKRMRQGI